MFLSKIVRKKSVGSQAMASVKAIVGARLFLGAIAVVGAAIPIAWAVRKQLSGRAVRLRLAEAKEAARKLPHAGKPRKARRIARHLAKTLGPATSTA